MKMQAINKDQYTAFNITQKVIEKKYYNQNDNRVLTPVFKPLLITKKK